MSCLSSDITCKTMPAPSSSSATCQTYRLSPTVIFLRLLVATAIREGPNVSSHWRPASDAQSGNRAPSGRSVQSDCSAGSLRAASVQDLWFRRLPEELSGNCPHLGLIPAFSAPDSLGIAKPNGDVILGCTAVLKSSHNCGELALDLDYVATLEHALIYAERSR